MDASPLESAAAMRALAHPLRPRLLQLLRRGGASTASALARQLGSSSGDTSYHLRQLARFGLIEEDTSRGSRRERWWRAAAMATSFDPGALRRPDVREAMWALQQIRLTVHADEIGRTLLAPDVPDAWRERFATNDFELELTVAELHGLMTEVHALVDRHRATPEDGQDRRRIRFAVDAIPLVEDG